MFAPAIAALSLGIWTIINADIAEGTGRFGSMQGMIACAWSLGAACSNYLVGAVATAHGFSRGFLLEGGIAVIGAIWFLAMMPETSNLDRKQIPVKALADL